MVEVYAVFEEDLQCCILLVTCCACRLITPREKDDRSHEIVGTVS